MNDLLNSLLQSAFDEQFLSTFTKCWTALSNTSTGTLDDFMELFTTRLHEINFICLLLSCFPFACILYVSFVHESVRWSGETFTRIEIDVHTRPWLPEIPETCGFHSRLRDLEPCLATLSTEWSRSRFQSRVSCSSDSVFIDSVATRKKTCYLILAGSKGFKKFLIIGGKNL